MKPIGLYPTLSCVLTCGAFSFGTPEALAQVFTGFDNVVSGDTVAGQDLTVLTDDDDPVTILNLADGGTPGAYTLGGDLTVRSDATQASATNVAEVSTFGRILRNEGDFRTLTPDNGQFEFGLFASDIDNVGTFDIQNGVSFVRDFGEVTNVGEFILGDLAQLETNTFNQDGGSLTVNGSLDTNTFNFNGGDVSTPLNFDDGDLNLNTTNAIDARFTNFGNAVSGDTVAGQDLTVLTGDDDPVTILNLADGNTPGVYTLGGDLTVRSDATQASATNVAEVSTFGRILRNEGDFRTLTPDNGQFEFGLFASDIDNVGTFDIQNGVSFVRNFGEVTNIGDFILGDFAQLETNTFNQDGGSLTVNGSLDTNTFNFNGGDRQHTTQLRRRRPQPQHHQRHRCPVRQLR